MGAFFSCYSILLKNRPKRPRFSGKIRFIVSKTISSLILTLTSILSLKTFFSFFEISHFVNEIPSDFKCGVSVELTEFLDNIFKMPIFKSKFNFFKILKANMVKHPKRVMTIYFFSRYLDFQGPK